MAMKAALTGRKAVFAEGILLVLIGLVAMVEGLRLVIHKEPNTLYDPLGPGYYAFAVSLCLLAVGVAYLVVHLRKPPEAEMSSVDRKMIVRLISTVATCGIYIILIGLIGYLPATIFFFLVELRIEGIGSWLSVTLLSLVASGLYYLVFVRLCNMVFPAGMLFG